MLLDTEVDLPWLEVLLDNYLSDGGVHLDKLERLCSRYPIVFHSVGFNLGSVDPLDKSHILKIRRLCDRFSPSWVSDHLAWTGVRGRALHDLLPLPRNWGVVEHFSERLRMLTDILQRPVLIENISRYADPNDCEMDEWQFLSEVVEAADSGILLDINNACTNTRNGCPEIRNGFLSLPASRVKQIHLAGAEHVRGAWIDTHGAPIDDDVWTAFQLAVQKFGSVPACIERDNNVPRLSEMIAECKRATLVGATKGGDDREP